MISLNHRSGRRVALVARYPQPDPAMPQVISNHGMRMVQAALQRSDLDDLEVRAIDMTEGSVEALVEYLEAYDPDVIGFSTYLWSFPYFLAVAQRVKQSDPRRLIVFGGPSARPSMFEQPPFQAASEIVDVLVVGEGEDTFVELVRCRERSVANLRALAGIALHDGQTWIETVKRPLGDLNQLASPYEHRLVPHGGLAVLQTYRGCPFTCSFCEWGTLESPKRVREVDALVAEFEAMDEANTNGAILVDAGLNLNQLAFRNLHEAAKRTDFFRHRQFICEVYPSKVRSEHLEFLKLVGLPLVGMGLQSFDHDVLAHVERSYDEVPFEEQLRRLTDVAGVALEIIMGLPGDSPEQFQRSYERARSLPCALRVYHCVVLPSALMVRAPAEYRMQYDPISLKMQSCLGWEGDAIDRTTEFLNQQAREQGGQAGEFFWVFPPPA